MIKITETKENPVVGRKELKLEMESPINPTRDEVRKFVASEMKTSEDCVKILDIKGSFGVNKFDVRANVYSSREDMEKTENIRKRDKLPEKPVEVVEEKVEEKTE